MFCLGWLESTGEGMTCRLRVDLTGELDGEAEEVRSISASRCLTMDL